MSTISIIIPVYKVEDYLDECITSVINQTYKDLEIILVDDGSPDRCPQMCDEWAKKDPRIKVVHKKNGGLSDARNYGLDNAKGDYIYFMDSDDIIEPTAIENLYKAITSGDYAIAISYFVKYINGETSIFKKDWIFEKPRVIEPEEFAERMLMEKSNHAATAKLYRRCVFDNTRFRLGKRNEDTLLDVDLINVMEGNHYRCIDIPDYSYYYRMHEGSICHNSKIPLGVDIIQNSEVAIKACSGKDNIIQFLKKRQFHTTMDLAFRFTLNRDYPISIFKDNWLYLRHFSNEYVKHTYDRGEFMRFLFLKYCPIIFFLYYRIRGRQMNK